MSAQPEAKTPEIIGSEPERRTNLHRPDESNDVTTTWAPVVKPLFQQLSELFGAELVAGPVKAVRGRWAGFLPYLPAYLTMVNAGFKRGFSGAMGVVWTISDTGAPSQWTGNEEVRAGLWEAIAASLSSGLSTMLGRNVALAALGEPVTGSPTDLTAAVSGANGEKEGHLIYVEAGGDGLTFFLGLIVGDDLAETVAGMEPIEEKSQKGPEKGGNPHQAAGSRAQANVGAGVAGTGVAGGGVSGADVAGGGPAAPGGMAAASSATAAGGMVAAGGGLVAEKRPRLEEFPRETGPRPPERDLEAIWDLPLHLTVEVGKTRVLLKEVLSLGKGSVVELDRQAGDLVDVFVNGKLMAKGEVVVLPDGNFGVRVVEVIGAHERLQNLQAER
ncbi:MAG TPA: flagellar motor switch protein FliN [Firmicutes bacterium]|nr:flagellar motor switch protein FliN [Bacillota bacterium]